MDEKAQKIIDVGKKYIEVAKSDPVLTLDHTDKSIQNVQHWVASLNQKDFSNEYKSKAMIGFAVYIGELLMKKLPRFEFNILFDKEGVVEEIQVKDKMGREVNLLSWVKKCYNDPEGEQIPIKYKRVIEMFSKG